MSILRHLQSISECFWIALVVVFCVTGALSLCELRLCVLLLSGTAISRLCPILVGVFVSQPPEVG